MATAELTRTRQEEILGAVDVLIEQWADWAEDPHSPEAIEEDSALEDAIQVAIAIGNTGDVPSHCRELVNAIGRLELEHTKYREGDFNAQTRAPLRRHSAAFEAVVRARQGAKPQAKTIVEPVKLLREQKVSDLQIARMYGAINRKTGKYWGPFFNENGIHNSTLISQEADKPGSIITDSFVHPQDVEAGQAQESELAARLNRLQAMADEDKPQKFSETDVIAYLKEGAFAHQAARVYKIPLSEVYRIARDAKMSLPGAEDHLMSPLTTVGAGRKDSEPEMVEKAVEADIDDAVWKMVSKGTGIPEIRKIVNKHFRVGKSIEEIKAIIDRTPAPAATE